MTGYIAWFRDIRLEDLPRVGGKNASLGELYGELTTAGVRVPNGFAVTGEAYAALLDESGLRRPRGGDPRGTSPARTWPCWPEPRPRSEGSSWRHPGRPASSSEIREAYDALAQEAGPDPSVAVRSSATAEDLPEASFAGQQETLPRRAGRRRGRRRVPALLRLALHRPGHRLPDPARVRSPGGPPLHRRPAHGPRRSGRGRASCSPSTPRAASRDVVLDQQRLRPRARPSSRGSSIPTSSGSSSRRSARASRRILKRTLGRKDWKLGLGADGTPARVEVPAEAQPTPQPGGRRGARAGASRDRDRDALLGEGRSADADGHRVGARTARTGASTFSRRAPRRCTGPSAGR